MAIRDHQNKSFQAKPGKTPIIVDAINRSLDHVEAEITKSGFHPNDIVLLDIYTTDIELCLQHFDIIQDRLSRSGCRYSYSLFGLTQLDLPEAIIEIRTRVVN